MCLQPPFNVQARAQAGFGPEWYMPLATLPKFAATAKTLQQEFIGMQLQQIDAVATGATA